MTKQTCPKLLELIKKYNIGSFEKSYVNLFDKNIDLYPLEKLAQAEVIYIDINYVNQTCKMKLNLR